MPRLPLWMGRSTFSGGTQAHANAVIKTTEAYDPATDTWKTLTDMPTARLGLTAVPVDGKIYVIGGWGAGSFESVVEVYDPATDTWETKAPLPSAIGDGGFAGFEGKVYMFGGTRGPNRNTGDTQVYDPVADQWETKASMPSARLFPSATVLDGKFYVLGSNLPTTDTVDVYDPNTDTWAEGLTMPTARGGLSAVTLNGKIYAIGGHTGVTWETVGTVYDTVEVYTPQTDPSDPMLETVVLYGNIPDPFPQKAVPSRGGPDSFPTNVNIATMSAQPFLTGEHGIVSSISLPVAVNGSLTGVLHLEIWNDNSGKPGKKVASVGDIDMDSWTGAELEYQLVTFDSPVTGLESNTKYHAVFDQTDITVSGSGKTYFTSWLADSEGTNNAAKFQVRVNGNWSLTSSFVANVNYHVMEILEVSPPPIDEFNITIQPSDHGTVTSTPELPPYPSGTEVTLTATPSEGYEFTKWLIGEDESIDNPLTFTIEADTTVTPEFVEIPATFTLTIPAIDGGTVVASPEMETYQEGTTVTLTATPDEGYAFAGWEGDTNEEGNPLTITLIMDSDKSVAAKFRPIIIPEITGVVFDPVARSVSVTWLSHPDAIYEIQVSADLVRWETLETKQGTGEQTTIELNSAPNGERQHFYRLRETP